MAEQAARGDWFGHPRGLTFLFLTETWEKFSFFGMRALLVYYMVRHLGISQPHASVIYGMYTGAVYFTPIVGGAIADGWLGRRRAVMLGGAIMAAGHFMMPFESLFYIALVVIACGNGLFLPTLPSQIEDLYAAQDARRTSAYSVYYVGINLGAFIAPLVCGTIGEVFGWHWGFSAAGVGMMIGLTIYVCGSRYLPSGQPHAPESKTHSADPKPDQNGSRTWLLLLAVAIVVIAFRAAYEQAGNTVALWIDRGVDREVFGGRSIPMTWFLSLNPLVVFLFTPLVVAHWARRAERGVDHSPLIKMAVGSFVVAGSYLLLAAVSAQAAGGAVWWPWVVLFFVTMTTGELYILPVGLSLFGRLAPRRRTATTIGAWFLATSVGNLLGGAVGSFWSKLTPVTFFVLIAAIAAVAAVILQLLDLPARRMALSSRVVAHEVRTS